MKTTAKLIQFSKGVQEELDFQRFANDWLNIFKLDIVKDNTYAGNYEEPLRLHLIPYFGRMKISEITSRDVQLYFKSKKDTLSLETLRKHRSCLFSIFELAVDDGFREKNPVTKRVKVVSSVSPKIKQVWSQQQYDDAWNYAKTHPYGLPVMVLMETAITRSELLGLTWENFSSEKRTIEIKDGLVSMKNPHTGRVVLVHDGVKNKYRERVLPISRELNAYLYVKSQEERRCEFIFPSPQGKPFVPSNWSKRVLKPFMIDLKLAHGIPILTAHELRHTRASLLINAGKSSFAVMKLMGHANLKMLQQRYLHQNAEDIRNALGI